MEVISVATKRITYKSHVSSSHWFDNITAQTEGILHELQLVPTRRERDLIRQPISRSDEALELVGRSLANRIEAESLVTTEAELRRAILLDPNFQLAHQVLALTLLLQNKLAEAAIQASQATSEEPQEASAHCTLGSIYVAKGQMELARQEFLTAIEVDKDSVEGYYRLSEVYGLQGKWDLALTNVQQAVPLSPYDSRLRARLGIDYVHLGNESAARSELKAAESLNIDGNATVDEDLAIAYDTLKDVPSAVKHYEAFISCAKKAGVTLPTVRQIEDRLTALKASMIPHHVRSQPPKQLTEKDLTIALTGVLTPTECKMAVNPLTPTSEMSKWAQNLAGDGKDDADKAKRIYLGLTRPADLGAPSGFRTAQEVFHAWPDPMASFSCQEYAFLYVSLARSAGLRAFYALVNKDCNGRFVPHACAAVIINGQCLLADPAYAWFGAPHQSWILLNDLQTIGVYLCQLDDVAQNQYWCERSLQNWQSLTSS